MNYQNLIKKDQKYFERQINGIKNIILPLSEGNNLKTHLPKKVIKILKSYVQYKNFQVHIS